MIVNSSEDLRFRLIKLATWRDPRVAKMRHMVAVTQQSYCPRGGALRTLHLHPWSCRYLV